MQEVVIVDDHSMVRKGVAILVEELGWHVVHEACAILQANAYVRTSDWTFMIVDVNLPDGSGLDFVKGLRTAGYTQRILVHSLLSDDAAATRALRAGANGFISKTCEPDEFLRACSKLSSGGRYISPDYADKIAESMAEGVSINLHERLSEREYQVMCLIAVGKTPSEIADMIGCNVNTISTFRSRVLKKLELKTSMDIVRYAITRNLVQLS